MSVATTETGQIVPRNNKPTTALELRTKRLAQMLPAFKTALPKHLDADRMLRIGLTALRTTPKLAETTEASFFGAIISAAQLGLEVNTPLGHAYLLPFEERKNNRIICQLIIGYQGYIDLAYRSGRVDNIFAETVWKGDHFRHVLGLRPDIDHVPSDAADREDEDRNITHVYAVAKLKGADPVFKVLPRSKIEKLRARSRSAKAAYSPWATDYEAMALKTAVRQLRKWIPQSADMARAAIIDEAPELGRSQLAEMPEDVVHALVAEGIASPDEVVDETTGEVTPMREPGVD